jgi:hypothetical protein
MDIAARVTEMHKVTSLFPKFDSAGYDAYERSAPLLVDFINGTDEQWWDALGGAVVALGGLKANTDLEQWFDQEEGARIYKQIEVLWKTYVGTPFSEKV